MKPYFLFFILSSLAVCRANDMSFTDIHHMFANAFMKMGPDPVSKLVYPSGKMDFEIKSIFAHKVISVEVLPCSEKDLKSSSGGKIDWPAMPIAKLYVQTDGPEDKDFHDAYFTIGMVDNKFVLMSKVDTSSPPAWRGNILTWIK